MARLRARLEEASADPELRCVVLAGSGRFFCAGGDLKAYRAISTPQELAPFGAERVPQVGSAL